MTAPWPLLADLDALLSRDGWQEDEHREDRFQLLREISWQTRIGPQPRPEAFSWSGQWPPDCLDFLGSRDAAAMLEEAVLVGKRDMRGIHLEADGLWADVRITDGFDQLGAYELTGPYAEAAARTRAALEAGFRVGIWPVRREP